MRIVVVNATTDLYGANRILSLALQTFPRTCRIQLLLPELDGPLVKLIQNDNQNVELKVCSSLPIIQRKMFSLLGGVEAIKLFREFSSFLKRENSIETIDLLYVNTLSNFLVVPIAKALRINTLIHVHEILESPQFVSKLINKYTVQWGTKILAVSGAVKKNLLNSNPRQEQKISVIHNGIPDLLFGSTISEPTDRCIITLIARIKPEKGIWYFLEALALLSNKQAIQVRIIGGPAPYGENYIDKLKRDIKASPIEIEYISFTSEISKYLNETDILVVPSIMKDPFPTTVLEGMCCGKAVVATDTGGAVEALVHGVSGMLIKSDNAKQFALVLENLIANPSERKRLGTNARERYLAQFSISTYRIKMSQFINSQLPAI
jgi:glycosyltransferase involved in cell wall biosynthesis